MRLQRHHDHAEELFRFWQGVWLEPSFRQWDLMPLLASVRVPVLLIQGLEDEYGTLAQLDAIADRVCGPVTRLELARCGHSPHLDQPASTMAAIVAFLGSLAPSE